jgi:hypothetical protein
MCLSPVVYDFSDCSNVKCPIELVTLKVKAKPQTS